MQKTCTLVFLVLALALASGACRSTDSPVAGPAPVTEAIPEGQGRIYFYRNSGIGGSALKPMVRLNGMTAGQSTPGGYFVVDRDPGRYEAKCSVLMEHAIGFDLAAGETLYVQTRTTMGLYAGHVRPQIVDAGTGAAGVAKSKRTGGG